MKKILLALLLSMSTLSVSAAETVFIVYAWGPGDTVANFSRTLAYEANKTQDKYNFIFDTRPGAGGAVAANYVERTPGTILSHSTAFFVRPNLYPNESYDLTKYKELVTFCQASMAVGSKKYKTWKDVPTDKPITVGISGYGTSTHLVAVQLQNKFTNLNIIPFSSTTDSVQNMNGGHIDMHIGFLGEIEAQEANILGITGTKEINGHPTLVSNGFSDVFAKMNVSFHLLVPLTFNDVKLKEIHEILAKAEKTQEVRNTYKLDSCQPLETPFDKLTDWYNGHVEYWKSITKGVKIQ